MMPGRGDNAVKNRWYSWIRDRCEYNRQGQLMLTSNKPPDKRHRRFRYRPILPSIPPMPSLSTTPQQTETDDTTGQSSWSEGDLRRDFWEWVMEGVPELARVARERRQWDPGCHWF
jgi:hypothetical protein